MYTAHTLGLGALLGHKVAQEDDAAGAVHVLEDQVLAAPLQAPEVLARGAAERLGDQEGGRHDLGHLVRGLPELPRDALHELREAPVGPAVQEEHGLLRAPRATRRAPQRVAAAARVLEAILEEVLGREVAAPEEHLAERVAPASGTSCGSRRALRRSCRGAPPSMDVLHPAGGLPRRRVPIARAVGGKREAWLQSP